MNHVQSIEYAWMDLCYAFLGVSEEERLAIVSRLLGVPHE